jgi:aerobic-type carbon monoxide dehydrogenase small subunit (CoxS/CutS family)
VKVPINLVVNGEPWQLEVEPQETLVEVLRERMHLTGTKEGCGIGDCGTCVVLLEGVPVNSCLVLAVDVNGRRVLTIEGLGNEAGLHPLQDSFLEKGAVQCGFCTPAMIMNSKALLDRNPAAGEDEIKRALSGVLCRCGSYKKIVEAVQAAGEKMGGQK